MLCSAHVQAAFAYMGSTMVKEGGNEIPTAREQLAKLDVIDKIVPADAAHTQVETVKQILYEQGWDYLLTVIKNQKEQRQATVLQFGKSRVAAVGQFVVSQKRCRAIPHSSLPDSKGTGDASTICHFPRQRIIFTIG